MKLFLLMLLVPLFAFAGLDRISVQNLDMEYAAPYGKGTVEKIGIGLGLAPEAYPIEFIRQEHSIDLITPYVEFSWMNPLKFIYDLQAVSTKGLSGSLGTDNHSAVAESLMFIPRSGGEYKLDKLDAKCPGGFKGPFDIRLLEDCRKSLNLTIKRVDVPVDFFLYEVLEDLPKLPGTLDIPGDNIIAKISEGDLYLQIYIKYWFYAGLRTWGHVQYENNYQTVAIRVDQIKFGYLTVTNMVMKKLKEVIKSPDVKIDPPWIRIDVRKLRENQND